MSEDARKPLVGHYKSGQYVIICDKKQQEELKLLGCYGQDLKSAKRKDESRRGPSDIRLLESIGEDSDSGQALLALTLHEAFFLIYALGCMTITVGTPPETFDIDACWTTFRRYHIDSNIKIDFAIEFCVYYYFKVRGWVVKPGDNYGTNFLLYREGPRVEHAYFAVQILEATAPGDNDDNETSSKSSWMSLLTSYRVIQSVCKELLLVYVVRPSAKSFERPACIKDMQISMKRFSCKTNLMV